MESYRQSTKSRLFVVCLLWLSGALAAALASQHQYETEVVVKNQAPALRAAAMKTALQQVISRVTSDQSVMQAEPVQALLEKPSRIVRQYRYFTVPNSQPPTLKLWVRFDGGAIQQAMQQPAAALPVVKRPDTLVWLAVDEGGRHYLVSADDESDVRLQSQAAARARGIPILFPLMDLQDQSSARFSEIWKGSFENILKASARYNPQAVLVGRLQRSMSGNWSALWYLDNAGRTASWSGSSRQLAVLLQQGMDGAAERLSAGFSTQNGLPGSGVMSISVSDINSLESYARANGYLASLSSLRDFQVIEVNGSEVQYRLYLNGTQQELLRMISIGTVLEPAADRLPGHYRLRQ